MGVPLMGLRGPKPKPPVPCSEEGCGETSHARGLCNTHYTRVRSRERAAERRAGKPVVPPKMCGVDGCEKLADARGLCLNHYKKMRRGTLGADLKPKEAPKVPRRKTEPKPKPVLPPLRPLPPYVRPLTPPDPPTGPWVEWPKEDTWQARHDAVVRAMEACAGSAVAAARMLRVDRDTLSFYLYDDDQEEKG